MIMIIITMELNGVVLLIITQGINKCNEINVFWYYTGGGHGGCGPMVM